MTAGGLDARGMPAGYPFKPDWEVTPRDLREAMRNPTGPVVLDVRTAEERGIAAISGSVHVPMSEIESRLGEVELLADDGAREIVTYCHHGVRSLKVAAFLRQHGITARSMAGGIDLWSRDVDPSLPLYARGPDGWASVPPTAAT